MDSKTEQLFIARAKKGDAEAFEALYNAYYSRIHKYISYKSGSEEAASDVCQQVFLGAFQNIASYSNKRGNFSSWLFRIAFNKSMNYLRSLYRNKEDSFDNMPEQIAGGSQNSPEQLFIGSEQSIKVRKAVSKLNGLQKKVVEYRFFGECSVKEVANIIGKSRGAVKLLQFRALKKLKDLV